MRIRRLSGAQSLIPWIFAVAGLALLLCSEKIASVSGVYATYYYDRLVHGGDLALNGKCLRLPSRWALLQQPSTSGSVQVQRHFVKKPEFATIREANLWESLRHQLDRQVNVSEKIVVFRLPAGHSREEPVYIAYDEKRKIWITGTDMDTVVELGSFLETC